jgi:hypothetical protein
LSGERLARDDAFALLRRAVTELASGESAVPAEAVRQKVHSMLGRDSESLQQRFFSRILRDAHDASILDVRKRGDSFDVALAASAPPVAEQIGKAVAARAAAAPAAPPAMRSMAPRRAGRGKSGELPPPLLNVGVVDMDEPAPAPAKATPAATQAAPAKKAAKKKTAAKRTTKAKTKTK